jgi:hypothetical protein
MRVYIPKQERTIENNPEKAPVATRIFELYASGNHSLSSVSKIVKDEFGLVFSKSYLVKILKNPFYVGMFYWGPLRQCSSCIPGAQQAEAEETPVCLRWSVALRL